MRDLKILKKNELSMLSKVTALRTHRHTERRDRTQYHAAFAGSNGHIAGASAGDVVRHFSSPVLPFIVVLAK